MYTLKEELPKEIRFPIYQKAIDALESGRKHGLCILLPMLLWDLEHYLADTPDGSDWNYRDTVIAFPEIAPYITEIVMSNNPDQVRIRALKEIIKNQ